MFTWLFLLCFVFVFGNFKRLVWDLEDLFSVNQLFSSPYFSLFSVWFYDLSSFCLINHILNFQEHFAVCCLVSKSFQVSLESSALCLVSRCLCLPVFLFWIVDVHWTLQRDSLLQVRETGNEMQMRKKPHRLFSWGMKASFAFYCSFCCLLNSILFFLFFSTLIFPSCFLSWRLSSYYFMMSSFSVFPSTSFLVF